MASNGEGATFIEPPILNGRNYTFWKDNIKRYIKKVNVDFWKVIKEGIPLVKNECNKKSFQTDCRVKNIISAYICKSIFLDICESRSARDMWNTLKHTYEGASITSTSYHPGDLSESPTMDESTNVFTECIDRKSTMIESEEEFERSLEDFESKSTCSSDIKDGYTEMNQETTTSCFESKDNANSSLVAKANQKPSESTVSNSDFEKGLSHVEKNESCNDSILELKINAKECFVYKSEVLLLEQKLNVLQNELNKLKQQNEELVVVNQSLVSKIESSAECKRCNVLQIENKFLNEPVAILTKENHILDLNRKPFSIKQSLRYVSKGKHRHKKTNFNSKNIKRFSCNPSEHTFHNYYLDTSLKCQGMNFKKRRLEYTKFSNNVFQKEKLYSYAYHNLPRYTSNFYKNKGIKEGKLIWIAKGSIPYTNEIGPKKIWVPKILH
jgi:hypothetical protein